MVLRTSVVKSPPANATPHNGHGSPMDGETLLLGPYFVSCMTAGMTYDTRGFHVSASLAYGDKNS